MKKLMIILLSTGILSFGLASDASAQRGGHIGFGGGFYGPRVVVGGGYYAPYYYPGLYFGVPWGYPYGYPYYGYGYAPSRLQMQIADIKQDYSDRIASVRSDRSLTGKERRQKVRDLKHERDNAIADAERNYWKNR